MKFVSKQSNFRAVLEVGVPGDPIHGRPGQAGLSVKFEDGTAIVNDLKIAERLMLHPGFGVDFIRVDEMEIDPFSAKRKDSEPRHVISEIKHGSVSSVDKDPKKLDPKIQEIISNEAMKLAKEMAPKLAVEFLKDLKEKSDASHPDESADTNTVLAKKKPGRPAKKTSVKAV